METLSAQTEPVLATNILQMNELLANLPSNEAAFIQQFADTVHFPAGQILHRPGDPLDYCYFPISGLISLLADTGNDTSSEVGLIGRESAMGKMSIYLPNAVIPWIVLIQAEARAIRVPATAMARVSDVAPVLWERCSRNLAMLLAHISQTAGCNARHSLSERLAKWLLMASDRLENDVVPLTHEFLANMLGVRRAGVTVTLNELQNAGLIGSARGRISIVNRPALENASCACYGILKRRYGTIKGMVEA